MQKKLNQTKRKLLWLHKHIALYVFVNLFPNIVFFIVVVVIVWKRKSNWSRNMSSTICITYYGLSVYVFSVCSVQLLCNSVQGTGKKRKNIWNFFLKKKARTYHSGMKFIVRIAINIAKFYFCYSLLFI